LLREADATRGFIIGVGIVGVAQSFLVIAQATIIANTVTHFFDPGTLTFDIHNTDGVWTAVGWLLLVFAVRGVLTWATSVLAHRASAGVKSSLRRRVLAARLANPDSQVSTASVVTVMTSGLDAIDGYFGKYLPQFLLSATVPIIIGVTVAIHDLTSLIIVVVTVPLIPIFMVLIGRTTQAQVARRFKVQLRLANHFADLVAGLPTLQVFGRARAQSKGLAESEGLSRRHTMATLRVAFLSAGVLELFATLSVALIAVTIGFRVLAGDLDLNTALYVLVLAPEIYIPIRMVGVHFHDSANGDAAANAAYAIIDAAEARPVVSEADAKTSADPARSEQSERESQDLLNLSDVTYKYPGSDVDAVHGLSLSVRPGEIVALAGTSGAGKTTALNLALGLLAPDDGQVLVDGGQRLTTQRGPEWRDKVAWAGQIPGLLGPTVAEDVALGLPADQPVADHQDLLRDALDRVGGESIPLDHPVGDDGEALSAGERRRVAMARALLRVEQGGARLLLLDEPTAGLDEAREAQILSTLRDLGVGVLVVSHREAVLAAADRVVEVEAPDPATPLRSAQDDGNEGARDDGAGDARDDGAGDAQDDESVTEGAK